jgi:hypothetical protein
MGTLGFGLWALQRESPWGNSSLIVISGNFKKGGGWRVEVACSPQGGFHYLKRTFLFKEFLFLSAAQ